MKLTVEQSWIAFSENRQYVKTKKADRATWFLQFSAIEYLRNKKTLLRNCKFSPKIELVRTT